MFIYEEFKDNVLAQAGVNDVLNRAKFMMIRAEEVRVQVEERMKRYKNLAYLLFLAPNVPEVESTVEDLAINLGLSIEVHTVYTKDGYIIQIHRIPGKGSPVLLQHGLMCTSACWLTSGENSLAYLLSKAGYDVWMGNIRGNNYGSEHRTLNSSDSEFWKFTFHHFGTYDLPAIIDKVTSVSGYSKLNFVGHSMGSTSMLVASSQSQESMVRLNLVVLLAPVAAGHNMKSSLKSLTGLHRHQKILIEWLDLLYLPPKVGGLGWLKNRPLFPAVSDFFLKLFAGVKEGFIGSDIILHLPSTVSTYTLLHFSQNIGEKSFLAYDWGSAEENRKQYNQPVPPSYNIKQLSAPTAIFTAAQDTLSPPADMQHFAKVLPNMILAREVDMSHLGFLWGKSARKLVYDPILDLLRQYAM